MVLSDKEKEGVRKILESVQRPVKILFFRDESPRCKYCDIIEEMLSDISSVNGNVQFRVLDVESEEAKKFGVEGGPVMLFENKPNIRYRGAPSGHEFPAFLRSIISIAEGSVDMDVAVAKKIAKIQEPIQLLIFVTPACPYCSPAVISAHRFAHVNENILAEMVEAAEWAELADEYRVSAVPKIVVIDPKTGKTLKEWEGAVPEEVFADHIVNALEAKEDV